MMAQPPIALVGESVLADVDHRRIVVEAFALAIQDFLIFYQHQVNELSQKAAKRREDENKLLFKGLA